MKNIINLPCNDNDISNLKTGDIFYLSGTLFTGRDEVHRRVVEENIMPPVDLKNAAIYHAGPIVKKNGENFDLVSIGPTSSIRMEKWAADFIKKTGVKIMIGKGGMGEKTAATCREYGAVHCVYPGGCAVLGASQIEKIENCLWPEFGMAECLWVMRARSKASSTRSKASSTRSKASSARSEASSIRNEAALMFGPLIVSIDTRGHNLFTN